MKFVIHFGRPGELGPDGMVDAKNEGLMRQDGR